MALVTKTYTFSSGATILASEHNTNFDTLYNLVNGNLDNANVKANAAIVATKLDLSTPGPIGDTTPSTAEFSSLKMTETVTSISSDNTFGDNSDAILPTQKAVKSFVTQGGRTLQTVMAITQAADSTTTTIPADDSNPQITEGALALSLSITPISATSILIIEAEAQMSCSDNGVAVIALFKDSGADALATGMEYISANDTVASPSFKYYLVSGGTTAITFTLRYGSAGVTTYLNRRSTAELYNNTLCTSLKITEVAQ